MIQPSQRRMKILFLSSGDRVPSSRFRILPYLKHFRSEGHLAVLATSFPAKYDYFPWMGFRPSQMLKRGVRWWHWLRSKLSSFDMVYVDREIFDNETTDMEERFRSSCRRLVIDLDDAVFLRYPDKFDRLLKMADLVICGNRYLVEYARPKSSRRCLVPTSVDLEMYSVRSEKIADIPVIGWMGTAGNVRYLSVAAEALRRLAAEQKFELRIIAPNLDELKSMDLSGVQIRHEFWTPETETHQLQQFDVGLMPLFADQPWDVYKCGAKLIQYLAVGVPGVASPVGVNSEILDNDQNGYCAQTTEDWLNALRQLLQSPALRRQMGLRGRRTVEDRYSIQANYPVLRNALLELLNG